MTDNRIFPAGYFPRSKHPSSSARLQQRSHMSFYFNRGLVSGPVCAVGLSQYRQHAKQLQGEGNKFIEIVIVERCIQK